MCPLGQGQGQEFWDVPSITLTQKNDSPQRGLGRYYQQRAVVSQES